MSHSAPSVSERRLEERCGPGRQDSSAAEGPFSPAGLKVRPGQAVRLPKAFGWCTHLPLRKTEWGPETNKARF